MIFGIGSVLVHLDVDSLVLDAVEFCGFGDWPQTQVRNFFQQSDANVLFACVPAFDRPPALRLVARLNGTDLQCQYRHKVSVVTLSRNSESSTPPDDTCNFGAIS